MAMLSDNWWEGFTKEDWQNAIASNPEAWAWAFQPTTQPLQTTGTLSVGPGPAPTPAPVETTPEMTKQDWQMAILRNPDAWGDNLLYGGVDPGQTQYADDLKHRTHVEWGLDTRPDLTGTQYENLYLPNRPTRDPDKVELWHRYYNDNPELRSLLSLDEQQDLLFLDHRTGALSQKEYKTESYNLRKNFGLERHYGMPGRESHRFEYQWDVPEKFLTDDAYYDFTRAHQEIGGFFDKEDLPGNSFFQDIINNPYLELAANIVAPGWGTLAFTAARAADGQTLHAEDWGRLIGSFSPQLGGMLSSGTGGLISPTIGSGIVAGGAEAIAGGDLEDVLTAGGVNIAANTVANVIKHRVMQTGQPTSEILNDVLPDDIAESVGDWIDDNILGDYTKPSVFEGRGDVTWVGEDGEEWSYIEDVAKHPDGSPVSLPDGRVIMNDGTIVTVVDEIANNAEIPNWVTEVLTSEPMMDYMEWRFPTPVLGGGGGGAGQSTFETPVIGGIPTGPDTEVDYEEPDIFADTTDEDTTIDEEPKIEDQPEPEEPEIEPPPEEPDVEDKPKPEEPLVTTTPDPFEPPPEPEEPLVYEPTPDVAEPEDPPLGGGGTTGASAGGGMLLAAEPEWDDFMAGINTHFEMLKRLGISESDYLQQLINRIRAA